MAKILVINPNSSKSVTKSMDECLAEVKQRTAHQVDCIELAKSPPGIENDDHVIEVVPQIACWFASLRRARLRGCCWCHDYRRPVPS